MSEADLQRATLDLARLLGWRTCACGTEFSYERGGKGGRPPTLCPGCKERKRLERNAKLIVPDHLRQRNYTRGPAITRALNRALAGSNGCWIWDGALTSSGYGHIGIGNGRMRPAHVVTYEHFRGPVPEGLELDHLCRVRRCFNPWHLEAVTHAENVRRGAATIHEKTGRCRKGHDLSIHGYVRNDRNGRMNCRECRRLIRAKAKRP